MKPLKNRLKVIFDLVEVGAKVADIGTDHAYLPIALSLSGKAKKVIACDIKESPLKKARENIEKFSANVETRLCDGLSSVKRDEVDTIIIAGMGGDVITHILSSCDFIKDKDLTLILQPMTSGEVLREYLTDNHFDIKKEVPVKDGTKIYSVILCSYSGVKKVYNKGFYYTGLVSKESEEGRLYLEKQRKRIQDYLNDICLLDQKEEEILNLKEILEYINKTLGG